MLSFLRRVVLALGLAGIASIFMRGSSSKETSDSSSGWKPIDSSEFD